jgi:acetylornithine/N-succinyldiaminopimelate aminotransferase
MNSQQWMEKADKYIMKTYGRYPLVPVRGEGCYLWDADGKRYLDFLAGVAVNNLGHCHPKVVEALRKQAGELIHCSNYYHIPSQIELAELLCENSFADRAFFCNSGAEANEAAIKLARKYSREKFGPDRYEIITAISSFLAGPWPRFPRPARRRCRNSSTRSSMVSAMCPSTTLDCWTLPSPQTPAP